MDDKRQKEIDAINRMIREQRARLDPEVLAMAERIAKQSQNIPVGEPVKTANIPYNREAATKAIELFLKNHSNAKEFQTKLFALLSKKDH